MTKALALLCLLASGCRSEETVTAVGEITGVNWAEQTITVQHEAIAGWSGPSTTVFPLANPGLAQSAMMGDTVRFELRRPDGKTLQITWLEPFSERRGMHDHTPRHGGIVVMHGMSHFEAVARADGVVRVFLEDRWRRPIPPETASGSVVLALGAERVSLPLRPHDGALQAEVQPFSGSEVQAAFRVVREGETFEMSFVLPITASAPDPIAIPRTGCVPGGEEAPPELQCVVSLPSPITAIVAARNGDEAFVAAVDLGVTAWSLDDGSLLRSFEAPPAVRGAADESADVESTNGLALQGAGDLLAVAFENRALLYETRSGRFRSGFTTGRGVLRDLRWTADDEALLVASSHTFEGRVFEARGGLLRRRLDVPAETSAVAVSRDGTRLAVGTSLGQVVVFATDGSRLETLEVAERTIRDLLLADEALVAAAADGTVRVIAGGSIRRVEVGTTVYRLARSPTDDRFASAGMDGVIRLHHGDGTVVARFDWHHREVFALSWPRPNLLISGDADGRVVFWRIGRVREARR